MASVPPTRPRCFCFSIKYIKPNYELQERRRNIPPDPLWLPPDEIAFTTLRESPWYYWDQGLVSQVPTARRAHIQLHRTTSMFWSSDREAFLHVPVDCTRVAVRKAMGGQNNDVPLQWSRISFHPLRIQNRCVSLVGYSYERNHLEAQGSPSWMPQLLPGAYRCRALPQHQGHCHLAGDLSVLLCLAGFSLPQAPADIIGRLLRETNQGTEWRHHEIGHGSKINLYLFPTRRRSH
jgi:hypothetical protein